MLITPARSFTEAGGFPNLQDMEIPDYKAEALYRHLKRIVDNAKYPPADTRTADALRLARRDLCDLGKRLNITKGDGRE